MYDFCIIGAGIVGLASAIEIARQKPNAKILVVDKEHAVGMHQTGHNSGVIHAGVYYPPGSLKATLCKEGASAVKAYCVQKGIEFEERGKLIVATSSEEVVRMEKLHANALQNGLKIRRLSAHELHEIEPNIKGEAALLVPASGIVDYKKVCTAMATEIVEAGSDLILNCKVIGISERTHEVVIETTRGSYQARQLICCSGLQSDRLARLAGLNTDYKIIPFRGEYYQIPDELSGIVRHLIYPVPDPSMPFLGIHLTPMIDGSLTVGPNAVIGFSREGYSKRSFNMKDCLEMALFPGSWKMGFKNWRYALAEYKNSVFKLQYLKECQKYCPSLNTGDLQPREAGIRAQAVRKDGTLIHDFLINQTSRSIYVGNAPSPAATSSIPIGRMIADKALKHR